MALEQDTIKEFNKERIEYFGKKQKKGFFSKIKNIFSPRKLFLSGLITVMSFLPMSCYETKINATKSNLAPTLDYIPQVVVNEGEIAAIIASANDPDGDPLTYSCNNSNFVQTNNEFEWQTGYYDAGPYIVRITVDDGRGGTDYQDVDVTVNDANGPPVLDPIADVDADETDLVTITATANDPENDPITYSCNDPNFVKTGNNTFEWQTDYDDEGNYVARITAEDNNGNSDYQDVNVNINNVNRSPVLDPIADVDADETDLIQIVLTANDPDNDPITYSCNDPNFVKTGNNTFEWQTDYDDEGNYVVRFTAEDNNGGSDYQDVNVNINNLNRQPVLDPVANVNQKTGTLVQIVLNANDPDNDPLIFDITGAINGKNFNKIGNNTFELQTDFADKGNYNFTASADDQNGGIDYENFQVILAENVIIYQSNDGDWEIKKMYLDGTAPTKITDNTTDDTMPDISPDGTKIAYISNIGGVGQLCIKGIDGTGYQELTTNAGNKTRPKWGASGDYIYYGSEETGNKEIFKIDVNTLLTENLTDIFPPDHSHSLSQNGQKLVFTTNRYPTNYDQVCVMGNDGSTIIRISIYYGRHERNPCWHPTNNDLIYFQTIRDTGTVWQIYRSNTDGTIQASVSDDLSKHYENPAISENGNYLLCFVDNDIWRMDSMDGSGKVQLTTTNNNSGPILCANGKIYFHRDNDIWDMDYDGLTERNLTNNGSGEDKNPTYK